jgi:hypothetical protein
MRGAAACLTLLGARGGGWAAAAAALAQQRWRAVVNRDRVRHGVRVLVVIMECLRTDWACRPRHEQHSTPLMASLDLTLLCLNRACQAARLRPVARVTRVHQRTKHATRCVGRTKGSIVTCLAVDNRRQSIYRVWCRVKATAPRVPGYITPQPQRYLVLPSYTAQAPPQCTQHSPVLHTRVQLTAAALRQ